MSETADVILRPIGRIRTPFTEAEGTPIQSAYADGAEGLVVVDEEYVAGLADLARFDRAWLIYFFDRTRTERLTVVPYRDTVERGVFATRAPCHPNRIGLSPVRLLCVEGNRLRVAGVDMLDGTPLLDIKPYVPEFDAFTDSRAGWLNEGINTRIADRRFDQSEREKEE